MAQLQVRDLHVTFGGLRAVDGMDFDVEQGEILCLLGPNGAGKSTTLDLICGKTQPTGGSIRFQDTEISQMLEFRRARLGIGRKFQVPSVYKELSVAENLSVAQSMKPGIWHALTTPAVRRSKKMREILDLVGLADKMSEPAGYLSHGETQWLEIAMLIAQNSRLILMDEPTAGMTIQETDRTAKIFRSLSANHTLIVVEHDMSFVRTVADRIIVMDQGAKLAEGSIEEIEANEAVKTAYLGH
ncbi:urea ABC transporter ATP-binding protein UrtD [Pseudohalocynthiibacter aestuariivivens]|uniref:Urea ABC transporter ATP-binding protein UrtD n=1 Tax=Roseovarius pelagicus TaxID=2980108 RepID=A0ABY6D897_9RHOB|nr:MULTISPECIES: urea ABC transporter ATP-binding protein UrtD [Rhodobacterales]QIE45723.1 urea ABC transporter ATP-binding protein UrtD [Pseudohalocynthiibacter aestuariivivens]UXX82349.1 urea ABC transporter ATP-binding protein UrtD [Roseovarius pelagicus]